MWRIRAGWCSFSCPSEPPFPISPLALPCHSQLDCESGHPRIALFPYVSPSPPNVIPAKAGIRGRGKGRRRHLPPFTALAFYSIWCYRHDFICENPPFLFQRKGARGMDCIKNEVLLSCHSQLDWESRYSFIIRPLPCKLDVTGDDTRPLPVEWILLHVVFSRTAQLMISNISNTTKKIRENAERIFISSTMFFVSFG